MRTAVVTGVTSGIGAALARRLLAAGMTVAGVARDADKLAALAATQGLIPVRADLAEPAERARAVAELRERLARVDVLCHNAAEVVYHAPAELPVARWRRLLEVNLLAGVELVGGLLDRIGPGGDVVLVSSATARFLPGARFGPYATSKRAVEEWARALRLELAPRGVRVTVIVPGLVDTPIYDQVAGFDEMRAKLRAQVPVWLSAGDVAEAIAWALARPPHVTVSELVLLPGGQAR